MLPAVDTLAKIDLFQSLRTEEILALNSRCVWRRAKAREWILDYRDAGTNVFFLAFGTVRVLVQSMEGRQTVLRDLQAGAFFGELAAIDGQERSASILALTDATIARMRATTFVETVTNHSQVCKTILLHMTRQIRALSDRVREFATLSIRERLSMELIRMSRPGDQPLNRAIISPPPTHAHLAGLIGTRRESVTRELNAMAGSGLIEGRRGAIVLLDIQRMVQDLKEEEGF